MLLFSYVDKISTCADAWFWFNLYIINEHDFKDYYIYKRTRFQTLSTLHVQVVWTDRRYIQVGMQPLFEQMEFLSSKDVLCQVWLKLTQWFLRRSFFKYRQWIFRYFLLSPHGKGCGPSFEQTWIPFTQGCFVPSLAEIGPAVL